MVTFWCVRYVEVGTSVGWNIRCQNQHDFTRGIWGDWRPAHPVDPGALQDPGAFFVPGHTAYPFPKSVQDIAAAGHEIEHHGWIHEVPAMVSPERERWILEQGCRSKSATAEGHRAKWQGGVRST